MGLSSYFTWVSDIHFGWFEWLRFSIAVNFEKVVRPFLFGFYWPDIWKSYSCNKKLSFQSVPFTPFWFFHIMKNSRFQTVAYQYTASRNYESSCSFSILSILSTRWKIDEIKSTCWYSTSRTRSGLNQLVRRHCINIIRCYLITKLYMRRKL